MKTFLYNFNNEYKDFKQCLTKMTNYIIDGSINFYEELMKDEEIDENNVCLLSNLPLDETHIQLPCSHKFNYIYLFNEVKSSKKPNYLNVGYSSNYHIRSDEIMCPYCRKRFDTLLPPCKNIQGASLIKNVNKSNKTLPIKCKNEDGNCDIQIYVTNLGHYCIKHYQKHKKTTNDQKNKNKQPKIKKHTKENCICSKNKNYIDSSMNIVNAIFDSSMNIVNTMNDSSSINKVHVNVDLINNHIIDVSELEYKIDTNYTINKLKEILKQNNLQVSGRKSELIKRIIDKKLYELQ